MNRENLLKYGLFIALVVLGVLADQWTKQVATDRLATTRYGQFTHSIHLTVPAAYEGKKVTTYLADEFTRNSPEEIETIAKRYTLLESKGLRLKPDSKLKTGQKLQIKRRKVVVIPGYFDFEYARNPGAAFSFLAEADDSFRRPFFIGVGILAFLVILWLLHGVEAGQWAMVWGLGLIASGAMGNFIDRVRLEYVVDFILWKYTDQYRWPVFNIADSLICVGVALMLLVLLRDAYQEWQEKNSPAPEVTIVEAEAGADSAADEADASTETPPLEEAGA